MSEHYEARLLLVAAALENNDAFMELLVEQCEALGDPDDGEGVWAPDPLVDPLLQVVLCVPVATAPEDVEAGQQAAEAKLEGAGWFLWGDWVVNDGFDTTVLVGKEKIEWDTEDPFEGVPLPKPVAPEEYADVRPPHERAKKWDRLFQANREPKDGGA